jgi:hypothetical protein
LKEMGASRARLFQPSLRSRRADVSVGSGEDDDIALGIAEPDLAVAGAGVHLRAIEDVRLVRLDPLQSLVEGVSPSL